MKKMVTIISLIIVIVVILVCLFIAINYNTAKIKGVIVKVNENNLLVMGIDNSTELYSVGLKEENNIEFKKGQEVLIYFDGTIMETYPAQPSNVKKIKIIKDISDVQIPENILIYCYSSKDNVKITINELTNSGISINIQDSNEIPYKYADIYTVYKKIKNENYTGVGVQIGENTENSTAGFTRNRNRIYLGRSRTNF